MARASIASAGWRWREKAVGSTNPATDEQPRQTAQATLALRVAPLFGLGGVAALGPDRRGSSRFAHSLPKPKIDCNAGHASISTGSLAPPARRRAGFALQDRATG
jgi:hypothetical protein